jgi:hypothetical protein
VVQLTTLSCSLSISRNGQFSQPFCLNCTHTSPKQQSDTRWCKRHQHQRERYKLPQESHATARNNPEPIGTEETAR